MSFSDAWIMAAAVALIYLFYVGSKILDFDFSCFQPENRKNISIKDLYVF